MVVLTGVKLEEDASHTPHVTRVGPTQLRYHFGRPGDILGYLWWLGSTNRQQVEIFWGNNFGGFETQSNTSA